MAGKTRRVKNRRGGSRTAADEALETAIRNQDLAGVRAALDAGAWINSWFVRDGSFLIHAASRRGPVALEIVRELIDRGANVNAFGKGLPALHMAAMLRNPDMVNLLLEKGADPNRQDEFRRPASELIEQMRRINERKAVAVTGAHPESTMPNPDVARVIGKFLGGKRKTRKLKNRKTGKRKTRK